ncbi:ATP-binding protein [Marinobacter bryozoorum]|uniref:ATP-binding protein n=1 Tax=Marinobacter bryozoorum TaxID=256324 RepID=UPI0020058411|nr:ATP-binding protein [Marinobacter bryozoorum]MCK7546035.1 ATP-binding protein [Marinobacter bryozoorum]
MLRTLVAKHDRILLCLDEAQHLVTRPEFENLVFFLRTFFDQNRQRVRVMYTGSSRDGLRKLFNKRKAALFQSSSQMELPQLGSGFVVHMRQCYKQATTHDFSLRDGLVAFSMLNYVPREFRSVLEIMILSGSIDIINEAAKARDEQIEDGNYPATWNSLKGIDQALLTWIAHGGVGLYQEACKDYIANHLGIDASQIETHQIQNAVNRLRGEHLSLVSHGNYEFEDARFQEWIQVTTDPPASLCQ